MNALTIDTEDMSFVGDLLQSHHLDENPYHAVFESTVDVFGLVELAARQRWRAWVLTFTRPPTVVVHLYASSSFRA